MTWKKGTVFKGYGVLLYKIHESGAAKCRNFNINLLTIVFDDSSMLLDSIIFNIVLQKPDKGHYLFY